MELLKISDFFEKKYIFINKIIQNKLDYIWNKFRSKTQLFFMGNILEHI